MNDILSCKSLNKKFFEGKHALHVLKDIDLEIKKGEFVSIIGPSGAGKSTLVHILGGLDEPTTGSVYFEGKNLKHISDANLSRIRNKSIGFVFQFYHLLGELSAIENIILPHLIQNDSFLRRPDIKGLGIEQLKIVGLEDRARHKPNELSGGEKQRVAIARSLINKPDILFCDEPTGNLDSKASSEIFELLKKINIENKTTVVVVTHNKELAKISDRIVNIKDGRIV